jgi:CDP-glycerol glycerophosphotransferase
MYIKHILYNLVVYISSYIFRIFPIDGKKIVVANFFGNGYGDSPKYIIEKLMNNNDKLKIVWLINKRKVEKHDLPSQIKIVEYFSIRAVYELVTAKIWIDNTRKKYSIKRRTNQYYIQTWHGGIPLKYIEKDTEKTLSRRYLKLAQRDSKNITHFLSNSEYNTNIIKKAFWYNGIVLESGIPRCDIISEKCLKVNKIYNIPISNKIILYAPTFRNGKNSDFHKLDYNTLIDTFQKKFNCQITFLVRYHPNTEVVTKLPDSIINVTNYSDMYELLSACDFLITDYSSTMFELGYENKVVFLYLKDHQDYLIERKLYFDVESLPYAIAHTTEELIMKIATFSIDDYIRKNETFKLMLGYYNVKNSSHYVANYISNLIYENEK